MLQTRTTDLSINIFPGLAAFPEPSRTDCSSCEDLGRTYRDAMIAHLLAVDELDLSRFMQNGRRSLYLEGVVLRAEHKRDEARCAAAMHQSTHQTRLAA